MLYFKKVKDEKGRFKYRFLPGQFFSLASVPVAVDTKTNIIWANNPLKRFADALSEDAVYFVDEASVVPSLAYYEIVEEEHLLYSKVRYYIADIIKRDAAYSVITESGLGELADKAITAADTCQASLKEIVALNDFLAARQLSKGIGQVKKKSYVEKLAVTHAPPKDDRFFVDAITWVGIIRNVKKGLNSFLFGPTGSGKTELVQHIAESTKLPLHIFDMSAMYDPISSLIGVHRLEGTESIFDYSRFATCVEEECIILLDELNRAPVTTTNLLLPVLDNRRTLYAEAASSKIKREIKVNPKCRFIATGNIGTIYVGTNDIDRALADRFMFIHIPYMPKQNEEKVLIERTDISKEHADVLCTAADTIRSLFFSGDLTTPISPRHTLMAAELVVDGFSPIAAMEFVYLPMFSGTNTEGERAVVTSVIAKF